MHTIKKWKFSDTARKEAPEFEGTAKQFLAGKFEGAHAFGTMELMQSGIYKLGGWAFDFRPYLKTYVAKQYGTWYEWNAPNKTALRAVVYGRIDRIVEITPPA